MRKRDREREKPIQTVSVCVKSECMFVCCMNVYVHVCVGVCVWAIVCVCVYGFVCMHMRVCVRESET